VGWVRRSTLGQYLSCPANLISTDSIVGFARTIATSGAVLALAKLASKGMMIVWVFLHRVQLQFSARPRTVRSLLCPAVSNFDGHDILPPCYSFWIPQGRIIIIRPLACIARLAGGDVAVSGKIFTAVMVHYRANLCFLLQCTRRS
jgi:hypothetical protein